VPAICGIQFDARPKVWPASASTAMGVKPPDGAVGDQSDRKPRRRSTSKAATRHSATPGSGSHIVVACGDKSPFLNASPSVNNLDFDDLSEPKRRRAIANVRYVECTVGTKRHTGWHAENAA
jgi:hypothetical protein